MSINDEFHRDTHKDPHQLEREIDATRADLAATLEELEHRLSPSDLLGQLWDQVRRHGSDFGGNLGQSVKDNPVPVLLTSIGIAWMMASNGRRHAGNGANGHHRLYDEGRLADSEHGAGERLRESGERLRESGQRMGERIRGTRDSLLHRAGTAREGLMSARERMASSAHSMGDRARSMSSGARYRASRARAGFGHLLEEQPLLLGALGLAAGAIAGAVLPPTEQEDRAFGAARDRALERMKRAGSEGARHIRERAENVVDQAKSAAQEHTSEHGTDEGSPSGSRTETTREHIITETSESPTRTSHPGTGLEY